MEINRLKELVNQFGIEAENISRPAHAFLSDVYFIDEDHVLRARRLESDTSSKLEAEQVMLREVVRLTGLKLPLVLPHESGQLYLIEEKKVWTVYPIIKGKIKCTWYELQKLSKAENKILFNTLRELHNKTRGALLDHQRGKMFSSDVAEKFKIVAEQLSVADHSRIEEALKNVQEYESNLTTESLTYVHGDYHPGNVVFDDKDSVIGLIDTDWGRCGCYLEDLAYTTMMFISDYDHSSFSYVEDSVLTCLNYYAFDKTDLKIFFEYLILCSVYDVHLFSAMQNAADQEKYLKYRKQMLSELCKSV